MAKYVFPAVFTPDGKGYSVVFKDLDACYTSGVSLENALFMAEDVLALTLYDYEEEGRDIPDPSNKTETADNEFVNLIRCDTDEYRKRVNNRAVKKTLTIPEWLNIRAIEANINFSQVLQDALKEKLGVA